MKKGVFVYPRYTARKSDNAFAWLQKEASRVGLSLEICFEEDCVIEYGGDSMISFGGKNMDDVSFVVMRTYNERISRYYEGKSGVYVMNAADSMRVSRDKFLTHQVLHEAGIPAPRTIYAPGASYETIAEMLGENCFLVKQINGSKGENIFLVENSRQFEGAVKLLGSECIFQEFIHDSYGRDIRVWVIGGQCAGAVLRYSETSFLSNFSQGGKFAVIDIDEEASDLAVRATSAVGLDFAGVDLLFNNGSYSVCEVNGNAGFRTISKSSEISIPQCLFAFVATIVGKI